MTPDSSKRAERVVAFLLALAMLTFAAMMLWRAKDVVTTQYSVLAGCWDETTRLPGQDARPSAEVWNEVVDGLRLSPLDDFLYRWPFHSIHIVIGLLAALLGWSASILLRLVVEQKQAPDGVILTTWTSTGASLLLAALAGVLVAVMFVIGNTITDPCIARPMGYVNAIAAFAGGLSVTAFFEWFQDNVPILWAKLTGK